MEVEFTRELEKGNSPDLSVDEEGRSTKKVRNRNPDQSVRVIKGFSFKDVLLTIT